MDQTVLIQLTSVKPCKNKLIECKKLGIMFLKQNDLVRNVNVNNKSKKTKMNFMR